MLQKSTQVVGLPHFIDGHLFSEKFAFGAGVATLAI